MSFTLHGAPRPELGTRSARKLRASGRIPCNVQGEGRPEANLHLCEHEFLTARRHHEHLFDIEVEGGGETETAIVRELQWDLMGERIVHVELKRVVLGRETTAEVELQFIGHPRGGILNHLVTHLTIAAMPADLPDAIEIPVDELEEGHLIAAGDIPLPAGVRLVTDPATPVAGVTSARGLDVAAPSAEEAGAAAPEAGAEPAPEREE